VRGSVNQKEGVFVRRTLAGRAEGASGSFHHRGGLIISIM
jgi:hypothetical protein